MYGFVLYNAFSLIQIAAAEETTTQTAPAQILSDEGDNDLPALRTITPYVSTNTLDDEDGADAFRNSLDQPVSRYYMINDFYNMKSDANLHILSNFKTYQQTTDLR